MYVIKGELDHLKKILQKINRFFCQRVSSGPDTLFQIKPRRLDPDPRH
jgi:hypothetical protein